MVVFCVAFFIAWLIFGGLGGAFGCFAYLVSDIGGRGGGYSSSANVAQSQSENCGKEGGLCSGVTFCRLAFFGEGRWCLMSFFIALLLFVYENGGEGALGFPDFGVGVAR